MPALSLFTLTYLFSLLLFHSQAELPWIWPALHQHVNGTLTILLAWFLMCLVMARAGGVCNGRIPCLFWIALGFAMAQLCAGLQAAAHKDMQIPLSCNKQLIESEFRLLEKAHRDKGAQTWLIEKQASKPHSNSCVKEGARLEMFVEPTQTTPRILPGDVFQARLRIKSPKSTLQLHGFDIHRHWFANRIAGRVQAKGSLVVQNRPTLLRPLVWLERVRIAIAGQIVETLKNHPEHGLVLAMVIGDQGLISPQDRDMFSSTGVAHLIAISGLHITLFAMLSGQFAGLLWRLSRRLCLRIPAPLAGSAFGLCFALLYGLIAGWGIPAQRTVFMLLALFVGQLRSGSQSSWDTFVLALFLTLAFDNWAVLDAGFMLSFGAVAALIFVTQGHCLFIKPRHEFVANAVKAQYAATIALILPCALLFNQQSLISPLANALSIPWMSFVSTPLALLGGLFQQNWALLLAADSLSVQRDWLTFMNELPWASLPVHDQPGWIQCLVATGCIVLLMPPGIVSRWIGIVLVAFLAWPAPRPPEHNFWMTLMDVGQGSSIAIQTKNHLLIYDAGPAFNERSDSARRVILPWMASQGYSQPDMFMLSHDDADHSGGAAHLMSKAPPIAFSSSLVPDHPLNRMARESKAQTRFCHTMTSWVWDGVLFQPLAIEVKQAALKKLLAKNNQSCVLKISNASHSVLLAGDIEAVSELQLLATHGAAALKSDVLLVPHHGSKTSSTLPFLQAVRPHTGLIQSGWENQFGHPHKQVIDRYAAQGVQLHNTAQIGAMKWHFEHDNHWPFMMNASAHRQSYWHMHESSAEVP